MVLHLPSYSADPETCEIGIYLLTNEKTGETIPKEARLFATTRWELLHLIEWGYTRVTYRPDLARWDTENNTSY